MRCLCTQLFFIGELRRSEPGHRSAKRRGCCEAGGGAPRRPGTGNRRAGAGQALPQTLPPLETLITRVLAFRLARLAVIITIFLISADSAWPSGWRHSGRESPAALLMANLQANLRSQCAIADLAAEGAVQGYTAAVDGSPVSGDASRFANLTGEQLADRIAAVQAAIDAEAVGRAPAGVYGADSQPPLPGGDGDDDEDPPPGGGGPGGGVPRRLAALAAKLARLRAAQDKLAERQAVPGGPGLLGHRRPGRGGPGGRAAGGGRGGPGRQGRTSTRPRWRRGRPARRRGRTK